MIFENLSNKPNSELDLVKLVAGVIQANYQSQRNYAHFMKLEKVSDSLSKIVWIKSFDNREAFIDFYYASEFERANIRCFPTKNSFHVSVHGFMTSTFYEVYEDRIKPSRFVFPPTKNLESHRTPPRELIEEGMGDLLTQFRTKAKKAA